MTPQTQRAPASVGEVFRVFARTALQGFGGVQAAVQREVVERERWLTPEAFVELLAVAQVLPGPSGVNAAVMLGERYFGLRGALAALAGMMLAPLALVLLAATLYDHTQGLPAVAGALRGMAAVAAGMIAGTALSLAQGWRRSPLGPAAWLLAAGASFGAIALLRWPMVWVVPGLGVAACLWAAWRLARGRA